MSDNREFRKKPVVIEAFRMTKERRTNNADWPYWMLRAWQLDREAQGSLYPTKFGTGDGTISIGTLEGQLLVSWDDWIIKGVKGELYPCKSDVFELTYEPIKQAVTAEPVEPSMVTVPREPERDRLVSMAIRYDHALGVPGYYDNPAFAHFGGVGHAKRLEGTIISMRQLYEEAIGQGFYPNNKAMIAAIGSKRER